MHIGSWRTWNTAAFLAALLIFLLAAVLPLGGRTTVEVTALVPVLASPASYALSIWWLIYALLAGYVWLQWRRQWENQPVFRRTGAWFAASCFFQMGWLLAWHSLHVRSAVFLMIGLLLTLVPLYVSTRRVKGVPRDDDGLVAKLFVQLPFSIYAGWVTVATLSNVAVGLELAGWNRWGLEAYWTFLLLLGGAAAGVAAFRRYRDAAYVLAIAWGYVAIGVEQRDAVPLIAWIAWLLAALLALVALRLVPVRRRRR